MNVLLAHDYVSSEAWTEELANGNTMLYFDKSGSSSPALAWK